MARRRRISGEKQKQTQKQENIQQVVVKLDGERRKRRRAKKRQTKMLFDERYYRQLPAPVIYQSTTTIPQLVPAYGPPPSPSPLFNPPIPAPSIKPAVPEDRPFLEDLGIIGTEGPVEIMDIPTRTETLEELLTPVPLASPPPLELGSQIINIPRKRRNKKEMEEAQMMLREDVASTGLAQFEPLFNMSNPFMNDENISQITTTAPLYEMGRPPASFRRNTWSDLLLRYENMTGVPFQRRKGYTKAEFQRLVEKMENL
jgi:hypothetical protein